MVKVNHQIVETYEYSYRMMLILIWLEYYRKHPYLFVDCGAECDLSPCSLNLDKRTLPPPIHC